METQENPPSQSSFSEVPPSYVQVNVTATNDVELVPRQVEVQSSDSVVSMATTPLTAPQLQITKHAVPDKSLATSTATVFLDVLNQTIQIPISVDVATTAAHLSKQGISVTQDNTTLPSSSSLKSKNQPKKNSTGGGGKKGKEKNPWHFHLGGVRHCRVPLTPELKEVLEVAYVSRIMSKNFRKEGQPEKERIASITGLEIEKVQEWFKNRRKKDKLLQNRNRGFCLPKGRRGRKPIMPPSLPSPSPCPSTSHTTSKQPVSLLTSQSVRSSQAGTSSQLTLKSDSVACHGTGKNLVCQSVNAVDSPVHTLALTQPPVIGGSDRLVALATQAVNTVTNVAPV